MESDTLQIFGLMMSPLYVMGIYFVRDSMITKNCVVKMKTFLKMKYPTEAKDIL